MTYSAIPDALLSGLNDEQRHAVETLAGPLLIIAGPGSGKTRVLTQRIAALLATGRADPTQVLAVTFTNRAASEMRERVVALVGPEAWRMWVLTFHAACVRILRAHASLVGLPTSFSIVDAGDARGVIARVLEDDNPGSPVDKDSIRDAQQRISLAKNADQSPDDLARNSDYGWVAPIMESYNRRLRAMGALDFDDILLFCLDLLRTHPDVAQQWRDRFRHVLVDEFQDTNVVQYRILRLLGAGADSLCVVGDPDQSIYAWRGATPEVVSAFKNDEPDCVTVVLNENYRSTPAILRTVQSIIDANPSPQRAHLRTSNNEGAPVRLVTAPSSREEARYVITEIRQRLSADPASGQYAVLVRTNFQTRGFEEELTRAGLPYQILGALRFYDRAEVKDALSYLRFALNPLDRVSLARCINTPRRGIGPTTAASVLDAPDPMALLREATGDGPTTLSLTRAQRAGMAALVEVLDAASEAAAVSPGTALRVITQRSGLRAALAEQKIGGAERVDNLDELVRSADDFAKAYAERDPRVLATVTDPAASSVSLAYLENVALVSANDDDTARADVVLLSAHASKGKEFNHVYVTGVEEGLFPHARALGASGIQEERRLLFVAASRAQLSLTFTRCAERWMFGTMKAATRSRFLRDLPEDVEEYTSDELVRPTRPSYSSLVDSARGRTPRQYPSSGQTARQYPPNRSTSTRPGATSSRPSSTAARTRPVAPSVLHPRTAPTPPVGPRLKSTDVSPGTRVLHGTYGVGVVRSVKDDAVVIVFDAGVKTLSLVYAPLQLVVDGG